MSELVSYQFGDGVATISLHSGKVNAFSSALTADLNAALDQAEADKAAVMLVGKPGIFSAGYDLKVMTQGGQEEIVALVNSGAALCRRLLAFPAPVVGVCTGHMMAQGVMVMLSCDYLIGVQGDFKLGLNEVQIGMTMPYYGVELVKARLRPNHFNRAVINAELFSPDAALQAGLLDSVVESDQLMAVAETEAKRLACLDRPAFKSTKLRLRHELLQKMDDAYVLDEAELRAADAG